MSSTKACTAIEAFAKYASIIVIASAQPTPNAAPLAARVFSGQVLRRVEQLVRPAAMPLMRLSAALRATTRKPVGLLQFLETLAASTCPCLAKRFRKMLRRAEELRQR